MANPETIGKEVTDAVARLRALKYTGKYMMELNFNEGGNDGKLRETIHRIITLKDFNKK